MTSFILGITPENKLSCTLTSFILRISQEKKMPKKSGQPSKPYAQLNTMKRKVRKAINLASSPTSSLAHIMYAVMLTLVEYPSDMVVLGVQYATEKGIQLSFEDLVSHVASNYSNVQVPFSKMVEFMELAIPGWFPKSPLQVITQMISERKIHSYIRVDKVIRYILECDLDEAKPLLVDEMLKSCQCAVRFCGPFGQRCEVQIDAFIKCIVENCNMVSYLEFLTTEKTMA